MIKLSLIGAGRIASAHAAAVEASEGRVKVSSVIDPDPSARRVLAERLDARPLASIEELLAESPLAAGTDGIILCTPPSARIEVVERAVVRGWGVLMEKPMANRLGACDRLVDLADAAPQTPCVVGFCHRFTPAVSVMVEAVRRGDIGRLIRVENTFAASIAGIGEHWMSDPRVSGGGSLLDSGLHSLDLMRYLLGPCELVGAVTSSTWPGRGDSNATVLLRSLGGGGLVDADEPIACQIASGWAEPSRFLLRLTGTEGALAYDFEQPEQLARIAPDGRVETVAVESHEVRFTEQLLAFADLIESPDRPSPLCRFREARESMRLVAQVDGAMPLEPKIVADPGMLHGVGARASASAAG